MPTLPPPPPPVAVALLTPGVPSGTLDGGAGVDDGFSIGGLSAVLGIGFDAGGAGRLSGSAGNVTDGSCCGGAGGPAPARRHGNRRRLGQRRRDRRRRRRCRRRPLLLRLRLVLGAFLLRVLLRLLGLAGGELGFLLVRVDLVVVLLLGLLNLLVVLLLRLGEVLVLLVDLLRVLGVLRRLRQLRRREVLLILLLDQQLHLFALGHDVDAGIGIGCPRARPARAASRARGVLPASGSKAGEDGDGLGELLRRRAAGVGRIHLLGVIGVIRVEVPTHHRARRGRSCQKSTGAVVMPSFQFGGRTSHCAAAGLDRPQHRVDLLLGILVGSVVAEFLRARLDAVHDLVFVVVELRAAVLEAGVGAADVELDGLETA